MTLGWRRTENGRQPSQTASSFWRRAKLESRFSLAIYTNLQEVITTLNATKTQASRQKLLAHLAVSP